MRFRISGPAAAILAAALLAACATPAERELHKISLASEDLWAEYDLCIARVEGTGAYRRLNRNYILTRNDPRSVEKMAVERPASDEERADLLQNHKNETRCNRELFKGFAEINPGFNVLLSRFMSEDDELVLQTIQGKLTVGSRNRIVQQRFAQRMRDWNFAGERIVRLHTWRLRRTCSIYCSSFSASSLLPTATAGVANLAGVTPLPPSAGQVAGLPPVVANPDDAATAAQVAAVPAAPTAPEAQPSRQAAAPVPLTPAVPEPKTAPEPAVQAPAVIPLPGVPKPTAQAALAEAQAVALAQTQAETQAETQGAVTPAVEASRPVPAAAPTTSTAPATSPAPATTTAMAASATTAATAAQQPATGVAAPAQKPASAAAPAAREATAPAQSETRTTSSAQKPPAPDAETGLEPAAGPAVAAKAQEKKQQPVRLASSAEKAARPVYTVHLASMDSEVEARAEWGKLQARYPAIFGDRVLFTREVTIGGKGTFVRVLTGLFHDRAQAKALCGNLRGGEQYCAILKL